MDRVVWTSGTIGRAARRNRDFRAAPRCDHAGLGLAPGLLPFTATGMITPFILLIILVERVELSNPTPIFLVAFALSGISLAAARVTE